MDLKITHINIGYNNCSRHIQDRMVFWIFGLLCLARSCTGERRIYLGSTTIGALAVLSGVLGILLICTATGCYLWNRRMSKSIEHSSEIHLDQREIERAYEQLQRQTSGETNRNIDDTYAVLSI
ncbi:uncharacterized protein LOC128206475 isoform X2 [Mya arenaria]|uniref:uncharacterized protein LOC128206475 isoform X2 n=1 Tax=Mya arenaria TaxID=6604 RepID=UPI0022E3BFC4|nr:uncharacterized protein LOC128206475 isoform X2 [Mya arenaria]